MQARSGAGETPDAYTDAEGRVEHRANIAPALDTLFAYHADNHTMTVYGQAAQELLDLANRPRPATPAAVGWILLEPAPASTVGAWLGYERSRAAKRTGR
jgi:hypothetical protein